MNWFCSSYLYISTKKKNDFKRFYIFLNRFEIFSAFESFSRYSVFRYFVIRYFVTLFSNTHALSMSSPRGWVRHRVGILTFSRKIIKFPTPGQKIIVKSISNKWFSSFLLFVIERSNDGNPHPGDTRHSKFLSVAQTPSGLTFIGA